MGGILRITSAFTGEVVDMDGHNQSSRPYIFGPHTACPDIVPRSAWEARETHCPKMTLPAKYAIIIHTAERTCNTSEECRGLVRTMQSLLMDRYDSCDTPYK